MKWCRRCIQGPLRLYWFLGSFLKLWRVLGSLWQGIIQVQVRLCGARYPDVGPGCYWRGPWWLPEARIRAQSYDLRPCKAGGGDMRDEEEDVDTRDNEACSHQHSQRHCRVEGPCGAAQG